MPDTKKDRLPEPAIDGILDPRIFAPEQAGEFATVKGDAPLATFVTVIGSRTAIASVAGWPFRVIIHSIPERVPIEGIAPGGTVRLSGEWQVSGTRTHAGTKYFVLEPLKKRAIGPPP